LVLRQGINTCNGTYQYGQVAATVHSKNLL
jgi:hypothetical protein